MNFDLIVVGGGLAGAALAVALRRSHLRVAVVEANAPQLPAGWDQRVYAYSPASIRFLDELGVWPHLERERLQAVAEMRVSGDAGGALRFSAYDCGLPELAWIGESNRIHRELWESLKRQHNVALFCPASPASLELLGDGVSLGLQDGRVLRARLVVGADGRDSWVRRQAGINASVSAYGERGVVANFDCAAPHRATAFQWFRDDGILAWLPLPGNRMSMVWSAPDEEAECLLALDEEAFCDRVAAAGGHALGALGLITPRAAFPLRMMRVESMVKERVALIGDAAHAIHPLSGHGINLGFQDAKALAEILATAPTWRDIGELAVLRAYARARAEEPFLMQYLTHGLNRLFGQQNPVLSALRNTGMNLTGHLPVLTNALTRYAVNGRF
ncbi:UbiH/UbiF family hydroxylase [Thauera linaloolentis]|uniref:Ubiquinone biosynthesis hydroxylase family protein n=1 Tax=Thauera linaloolentis (strain DSM 12138 / JCM 21573 / CCUG 41526 / CIP 105981 / IAM 15112 / NBRC 102519 / 47Lol) TaxID=1123367 RepID=N6YVZ1_THAL4|nr:UbiH/UbiF family hydroxylase [Thauera linaloolentis]ENO86592.1 ubiquinone biosynthesis hydroxylase family protein [Thauera linaloolentis 47Lol = DSM 12138]MCM8565778.1 UbiH/UbiF family hydroxylase [Thauera linaloolentis]